MASISKRGVKWRAQVKFKGKRKTKTFNSKAEAKLWAIRTENELADNSNSPAGNKTVAVLFERYGRDVSVKKRSYTWERKQIKRLLRLPVSAVKLSDLSANDMAAWRDMRLSEVSGATVLREWNLISHAFNVAINEWGWLTQNPLKKIARPSTPNSRDRLISQSEIDLILHCTGFDRCPDTKMSRVGAAFLFAIETAMRAGEIASIKPDLVDLDKRTVLLTMTKNGTSRKVPLSQKAIELLILVDCDFELTSSQISSLFAKARNSAGIDNLHFHDARHEAITRLAQKVEVLDLARMVGVRDLKILMVYYNKTAEDIAKKL